MDQSWGVEWGSICDNGWDDTTAKVACRQLGFAKGSKVVGVVESSGPILMDAVSCTGKETDLGHCFYRWRDHDCTHFAGVECVVDAWTELSGLDGPGGPMGRVGSSTTSVTSEEAGRGPWMLVFAGEAESQFQFFDDVWLYSYRALSWSPLPVSGARPAARAGHSAVWDATGLLLGKLNEVTLHS